MWPSDILDAGRPCGELGKFLIAVWGLTKQGKWSILAMQNLDRKEVCKMKKWLVGVVNHKRILRTSAFCQG